MATAYSNAGSSTASGNLRKTSLPVADGVRAGGRLVGKAMDGSCTYESNSTDGSSSGGSFSCTTVTSSGRSERTAAPATGGAALSTVPEMGSRRSGNSGGGKSKKRFVGVRQRPSGRWVAEIKDTTQKIRLWLGTFDTAEAAARAYDEAAFLLRGSNTRTNFVPSNSNADSSALPSKAARLLQLRRNAVAQSGNSKPQRQLPATNRSSNNGSLKSLKSEGNSIPIASKAVPTAAPCPVLAAGVVKHKPRSLQNEAPPMSCSTEEATGLKTENPSAEVSKSESSGFESSVGMALEAPIPPHEYNASNGSSTSGLITSHQFRGVGNCNKIEPMVKQELQTPMMRESKAIKESRKENDYGSDLPSQQCFVEDPDISMSSGLDNVDLGGEDSVYSSSPFDFTTDMGSGLDLESFGSSTLSHDEDSALFPEVKRLSYERQYSAGLYGMNGVQDCPPLSQSSWGSPGVSSLFGVSSPPLNLSASLRGSTSGSFLTSSPGLRKASSTNATAGNGGGWGVSINNSPSTTASNVGSENVESPREDALWQSWDLPPLLLVA